MISTLVAVVACGVCHLLGKQSGLVGLNKANASKVQYMKECVELEKQNYELQKRDLKYKQRENAARVREDQLVAKLQKASNLLSEATQKNKLE